MDVRIAIPDRHVSEGVLNAGLEAVTRVNEALIKEGAAPTFTQAVKKGVRWAPEPPGQESFDHAAKVAARGWGDCDDLAPHRAASLRVSGQDPLATAVVYKSGPGRWHAIVKRGNGELEDPSRTAGMKVREGSKAAGIAPAVVGAMGRCSVDGAVRPFVAVRRGHEDYLARVDVPIDEHASLSVVQHGRSPSAALSGCMAGACMVGGASGMVDDDALDKMWAMHGLMKGQSLGHVAEICGADAAKDALLTLKAIAPDLIEELRRHWDDARTLREDFDRMRKGTPTATASGAVPFVGAHRVHRRAAHNAGVALGRWRRQHLHGEEGDNRPGVEWGTGEGPDWTGRLAHDRVVSPFAQRFGHRGRQFVGAATASPYLDRAAHGASWGVPRAFGSNEAFGERERVAHVGTGMPSPSSLFAAVPSHNTPGANHFGSASPGFFERLAHDRVVSPFAERFGHRGRQFVGGAGLPFTPHLSLSLLGEHPGAAGHSPNGAREPRHNLQARIEAILDEALANVDPSVPIDAAELSHEILAALHAAHQVRRAHKHPGADKNADSASAKAIVKKADVAGALDRSLCARPVSFGVPIVVGGEIVGWDLFKDVVQPAAKAVSHIDLGKAVNDIGHAAVDVLKTAQGVISLIPGVGTGISAAISAGLALLSGGSPLDIAVKAAYGAIPIPPGVRNATDMIVDAALALVHTQNLEDTAIAAIRKATVDKLPSFAQGIGGTVFDTLAHIVLGFIHKQPTAAVVTPHPVKGFPPKVAAISKPASFAVLAKVAQAQAAARPAPSAMAAAAAAASAAAAKAAAAQAAANARAAAAKKTVVLHLPPPPKPKAPPPPPPEPAIVPVAATAPHLPIVRPAPMSLALVVQTMHPQVVRHVVMLPQGVRA